MRERGDCPECHLRDVTHIVELPDAPPIQVCKQCAWAYEFPAKVVPIEA